MKNQKRKGKEKERREERKEELAYKDGIVLCCYCRYQLFYSWYELFFLLVKQTHQYIIY